MLDLLAYDFMQRSLLAAAMVGGLCSVIGVFVVLRGLAFVGAGTSHAAFAGVALGYLMGWPPLLLAILFGTMDEMFEMLTWGQLGLHKKPIALLNINGYYDSLKVLVNNMVLEGFLEECTAEILMTSESVEELLSMMEQFEAPSVEQVMDHKSDT